MPPSARGGRARRARRRAAARAGLALCAALALALGAAGLAFVAAAPSAPQPDADQANGPAPEWAPSRRRAVLGAPAAAAAGAALAEAAPGAPPQLAAAAGPAEPKVTARCAFNIQLGTGQNMKKMRKVVIGLFGEHAPVLTQNFLHACAATYGGRAGKQVHYKSADVKAMAKDSYITWADFKGGNVFWTQVQTDDKRWVGTREEKYPLAEEDTYTDETNSLRHDMAGRVSMRRGGGTFDFSVAPVAGSKALDKTNVVIGQVLEGMDVIGDLNEMTIYQGKPLKKVRIATSTLLSPEEAAAPARPAVA